ncbi:unnamed protein product [Diatraea saccharalis]|uniref:Uncharacterized protein n=1 Tax=Diatraea saccharalis TaxID=40085 RepID=A0A9N9QZA2_9NEOP|nr:unnamed protein product [Diatraea saccharalis]
MTVPPTLRRLNLDGLQISICCVLTNKDSIDHLTDGINDHIDTITKVNFPTTNHLLDFLNASRKYIFTETWGYRVNGSWNGMTGFLIREEVEIGGSPMFFTSERISVVDYIASPTPTRSKFVFQQPKLSYENNLFLLSFRTSVWYSSVALIILLLLAIMLVGMWEWKKNKYNGEWENDNSGLLRPNLLDVMILIFGAVCQQGSPTELKGSLGRVVMLLLFIALMFLYTSYSANIVALLQSSSSKIRSLEDLLHSRLKFGVHDTVFNKYYFSTATEPVRKAIYEKKVAPPGTTPRFITMEEGVLKMRKGLFAFHMETGVGYKFVGKYFKEGEKCGLQEIQYLQVIDPWLAVRKNTPYKEMFKIGLKRIQEHGLQSRENRLLYEKRPKCSGRESNFVSVSMVDCYPALLILSYGCLLSLLLLFLELLVQRRRTVYRKLSCIKQIKLMNVLMNLDNPKTIHFVPKKWATMETMLPEHVMVVTDLNCPEIGDFLKVASSMKKFALPYRWLIIGKPINKSSAVSTDIESLNLLTDSNVVIAQLNGDDSFVLKMVYKMRINNSEWITEEFGIWTRLDGLKKNKLAETSISTRRKNFNGEPIKTAMVILDNKTRSDPYDLTDIFADTVTKSSFRSTDPIYGYLNATKSLIFSETWGYYKNGSYGGMIAELTVGEAELAGSKTFLHNDQGTVLIATQDRMEVVDYLSCPMPISIKFVFKEPPLSYQNNLFLLPFKTSVWYCMGAFVLILMLILYINALWEQRKLQKSESIATEPIRKAIYQNKIAPEGRKPRFMSIEEGVKKLQNEPFAFNMHKGIGYRLVERYFHEHEKCGLQEIAYLDDTKTYITCRKQSPYKEIFKIGLFRIKEHGLSDREDRLIYTRKPTCHSRGGSFGSVNMVDFHPVVVMYLYGILLSFLLLSIERLVYRRINMHRA